MSSDGFHTQGEAVQAFGPAAVRDAGAWIACGVKTRGAGFGVMAQGVGFRPSLSDPAPAP